MKLMNKVVENYLNDVGMDSKDLDFKVSKKWKVRAFSPLWFIEMGTIAASAFGLVRIMSAIITALSSIL